MTDENQTTDNAEEAALWAEFDEAETGAAPEAAQDDAESEPEEIQDEPETEAAEPEAAPETTDPWAKAPDELRTKYEQAQQMIARLEQSDRSNRGRLSALQRQINELLSKREEAAGDAAATEENDDDFERLAEDYPEIAKPIEKMISQMKTEQKKLQSELKEIGETRRVAELHEQEQLLATEHPDWDTVIDSGFTQWLQEQPRHIQEAAQRNSREIVDYREAADVVGRYKQFKGISEQPKPNNSLADKRQRQLKTATSTRGKGPGVSAGISEDGDPEMIWKQLEEEERRKSRA